MIPSNVIEFRTNTFLDEINAHFFHPRGLHALLMSYKPSERSKWSSAPLDISHTITKSLTPSSSTAGKIKGNLKFTSGKSYTELALPAAAPLIFPDLDAAAQVDEDTEAAKKKQNAFKKSSKFIGDYMDRRARAEYNAENPESLLSVPESKPFASRYSDPNHPAVTGGLISLVTGGHVDPRRPRKEARKARGPRGPIGKIRKVTGTDKPLKKIMRQDVVYLLVVNLPSEEELEATRKEMEREEAEKKEGKNNGKKSIFDF